MHDAAFHRSARPTLAIKGLSKRFTIGEQTVEALRDVNLTISKG
jgi:ABC-type oligopeptide transport system ATPase subunit